VNKNPLDSIHNQSWHWLYSKYTTNFDDGERKITFKTSLKCSKDSAINALISFASFPIINGLITRDSLIYVNKKDRCFEKKSIASLKELFGVNLSMKNIEELFLGLPIGYDTSLTYSILPSKSSDSTYYKTTTITGKGIEYTYGLSNRPKKIQWQKLISLSDETTVLITYSNWQEIDAISLPGEIEIEIKSKDQNFVVMFSYDKIELNLPLEIYLQIPEDYAPCH